MKKARCPYCGKTVSYFGVFAEKSKGEHTCKKCGRNSTIYFVSAYKLAITVTIVIALILMCVILFSSFVDKIWGALLIFIPFVALYLATPSFCRLVPIKRRKPVNDDKKEKKIKVYAPQTENGVTRIIPFVDKQEDDENIAADDKTKVMPVINERNTEDGYTDITNLKF